MANKNKYGLSKTIPPRTKRKVRQRCGYGCVICGNLFCQYHHFNPTFTEVKQHKAKGITLLCTKHHDDVTRKRISNKMVEKANLEPYCLHKDNPHYLFEDLEYPFEIALGGIVFISPDGVLLRADGRELLSIKQIDQNEPPLINAEFNSINNEKLKIVENEVIVSTGNWDIETKKAEVVVRSSKKEVFLHLVFTPPNRLQILKIQMISGDHIIDTEFGGKVYIQSASGAKIEFASGFIVTGGKVSLDSKRGIIIDGGSLMLGSESPNAFGGNLDYLFSQVKRLQDMSKEL